MKREFAQIGPGYKVKSLHAIPADQRLAAVRDTEGFYVSGGNTFLLLRELYDDDLLVAIRERVLQGTPYVGSSWGRTSRANSSAPLTIFPSPTSPLAELWD